MKSFCHLGSVHDSSDRCSPDILRRIRIAASSVGSLSRVRSQEKLSLPTKLQVYTTCIVLVLLYGSESWTLLSSDISHLEASNMRCQRRILRVTWQDMVRNTAITEKTGLQSVSAIIDAPRTALFGHVARVLTIVCQLAARCTSL